MLRFTGALTTALAAALVVPASPFAHALGQEDFRITSLESVLSDTVLALETLAGVEQRLGQGDPKAIAQVRELTEHAHADARSLDAELVTKRDEVNRLREELDRVESARALGPIHGRPTGRPTTGLDESLRKALAGLGSSTPAATTTSDGQPAGSAESIAVPTQGNERTGYSADPVGQARANFRAGRYAQALELLDRPGTDPLGWYWRGRTLEKLERLTEAVEAYEKVLELQPEGYEAERAKANLGFLEWKLAFLADLPEGASSGDTKGGERK